MATTKPETPQARLPQELRDSTSFLLKRIGHAAKERALEVFEATGLTPYHYAVLLALAEDSHETQGAIADALGYDRGQLVGLLDELEERGLVERRRDPADRRRQLVSATPAGRSFSRPTAVILSVDHESSLTTSTFAAAPSSPTLPSIARTIVSSAGQPRNVGVNSTRTASSATSTERMTPRSTSETTGISGSGISSSAAHTCSAVTIAHPPAPSAAPSSSPPTRARSRPCASRARPHRPRRDRRATQALHAARGGRRRARTATARSLQRGTAVRCAGARATSPRACGGTPPRG